MVGHRSTSVLRLLSTDLQGKMSREDQRVQSSSAINSGVQGVWVLMKGGISMRMWEWGSAEGCLIIKMNEAVFKQMEKVSHLQTGLNYPASDGKSRWRDQKIHDVSEVVLYMIQAISEVLGTVLTPLYKRDCKTGMSGTKLFGDWTHRLRDFGLCNMEKRRQRRSCFFFHYIERL